MSTVDPHHNGIQLSVLHDVERPLTSESPKPERHSPQPHHHSPHLSHHLYPQSVTHPLGHSGSSYGDPHVRRKHVHHYREPGFRKDFHIKLYKTPKEVVEGVIGAAEHKVGLTLDKTFVLGLMAGMYVGFGGMFALSVSQNLPHVDPGLQKLILGSLFAFALVLIIFMGGELFTGNTMYLTVGVLSGKIKPRQALLNLVTVYFSNWAGCCLVAYFFAYLTDMYAAEPYLSGVLSLASHKLELSAGVVFLRAIPANWMVCVGVFLNITAEDVTGKIVGMILAVACFASIGFEHCIANMFYVDLALMYGLDNSFGNFLAHNLILVTLGNIVGGAFFVGTVAYYVYCTGTVEATNKVDQKHKIKQIRDAKFIRWTWDKKNN